MIDALSFRALCTALHGMLFGGFFLLAAYAFVLELWRMHHGQTPRAYNRGERRRECVYLTVTAACGWAAVLTGTYLIYPWYRAVPPHPGQNLGLYPKFQLLANPHTAALHTVGMEWKEHIAFIAPIVFTAAAFVWLRYRLQLRQERVLRLGLLAFAGTALFATAAAATLGAFLNKVAPVQGTFRLP